MTEPADRLIDALVEDLEPVTPLPRVRSAFAVILAIWAAMLGIVLWSHEGVAGARSLLADPVYFMSFLGLLVASLGATASALAAGVPGRERLETIGMSLSFVGLATAAIACLVGLSDSGLSTTAPVAADGMCFERSLWFSVLPAGVILAFLVRGWASHPIRASLVALLASGALGALVVHLRCGLLEPRHILVGHLSVPIVLTLLGLYPLTLLLRRLRG